MAFSADSKMGELLDNPQTKEVLVKHLPDITNRGPMLTLARGMTLKTIASFPQAKELAEKLPAIVADLEKL